MSYVCLALWAASLAPELKLCVVTVSWPAVEGGGRIFAFVCFALRLAQGFIAATTTIEAMLSGLRVITRRW